MMQPEQAKNVFKQIFTDGWAAFIRRHPRYVTADEVVQKMLVQSGAKRVTFRR